MTVFNAEKYLKYSIQSILKQSYKNWELIIIDDCSTDNSLKVIKSFKNRKIRIFPLKKHIGRTNSLNYGLKKAKGKYLAILDADDISYKNRLLEQINYLKKYKNISLVGSWVEKINEKNEIFGEIKSTTNIEEIKQTMILKNLFVHSSVMFYRKILKKTGSYPSELIYMQDYGFILKVLKNHNINLIPKMLTKFRIIKSSMTHTVPQNQILDERKLLLKFTWVNFKKNFFTKILWAVEYIKILIKSFYLKF